MMPVERSTRPHVAGSSVIALRTFLGEKLGQEGYARLLSELPPHVTEPLHGILLPVNWYPLASYLAVMNAAARHGSIGGPAFFEEFGEFSAEYEITTFQRIILRFTSPAAFVEHAGRLWPRFHDSGHWEVESADKKIRGTLRNFAVVDPGFCRVLAAWIRHAGRLSAARFDLRHSECRARGADACVFSGSW
jgi:hypothetical protein